MPVSVAPDQVISVLDALTNRLPLAAFAVACDELPKDLWPTLFALLDLGAAIPDLDRYQQAVAAWPGEWWPEFSNVVQSLRALRHLVRNPSVPASARSPVVHTASDLDAAAAELARDRCTTIDCFFSPLERRDLELRVNELAAQKNGTWGEVLRPEAPALYSIIEAGLASDRFRHLTGFDVGADEFTVTLSLQSLSSEGIAWHRDLYWPKEWLGQDVFAVFYALSSDSPGKGGAFVYYPPTTNEVFALYRQQHQATILWNGRTPRDRILHAVSGFLTSNTERHLLILQCLRRGDTDRELAVSPVATKASRS